MTERGVFPCPSIVNGYYRHYRGTLVDVYGLSQDEATGVWCVLYRNAHSGLAFHMPAADFAQKFKAEAR